MDKTQSQAADFAPGFHSFALFANNGAHIVMRHCPLQIATRPYH